jgi:hypothetical protein
MNKLLVNTILVLGLLAASASFAEETSTPTTPEQRASYGKEIRAKIANMTPAERKTFFAEKKANWDSMTPEQRRAFRDAMRSPIAGMSKEERETFHAEMKEKMEHMTPEQRAEMKEHRAERMEHRAERMEHRGERVGK